MSVRHCLLLLVALMQLPIGNAQAAEHDDLTHLSIEDLMNLQVVSTAKQAQRLSDAAAAVFVITQDDIRRSGVTSVPEALRMAPGVQVARVDSNKWAVTARGFNGRFASKLLVLIDGRTVYTPTFSGVYWEVQDLLLEDIDRIEVIRGPGATLWGANAVNGVINIITKHTAATQGGLLSLTTGSEEKAIVGVRYGGQLGDSMQYRFYGKYLNRDGLVDASGKDAEDAWHLGRGGFRLDWSPSSRDSIMVLGDLYNGDLDQNLTVPTFIPPFSSREQDTARVAGGSLQARWQRTFSPSSQLSLQVYYQREERKETLQNAKVDTFDVDLHHTFALGDRHELTWGLGYRLNSDAYHATRLTSFTPSNRRYTLFSAFVQDRISLLPERLAFTIGTKLEHNDFTGWEFQPSAHLLWTPSPRQRVWAAVSRAVRTPSRGESDGRVNLFATPSPVPGGPPVLLEFQGNTDFASEKLMAYELGYRIWPTDQLSLDIALFYNDYDNLRGFDSGAAPFLETSLGAPHLVFPLLLGNGGTAHLYGLELAADWRPLDRWRLQLAYTYLHAHQVLDTANGTMQLGNTDSPRHQVSLRSSFDVRDDLEFDVWLRYVDELPAVSTTTLGGIVQVDGYLALDARLSWRPYRRLELSLIGTNLLDAQHLEFVPEIHPFPTQVERSFYGQLKWSF